jgi:Cu-Zn family superoxide dismutase
VRRITKAALGGLAGCALALGGTQAANGGVEDYTYPSVELTDLQPAPGPFDGASAKLRLKLTPTGSQFKLTVSGIALDAAGTEYGSHLHTGKCVEEDYGDLLKNGDEGMQAEGHYNHDKVLNISPVRISPTTEVWFDILSESDGTFTYQAGVPFVPVDVDNTMSIVIHSLPTNPADGKAGDRQACLPLNVSEWEPTPDPEVTN